MHNAGMLKLVAVVVLAAGTATSVIAQEPEPATREAAIEQAQAEKARSCTRTSRARSKHCSTISRASWSGEYHAGTHSSTVRSLAEASRSAWGTRTT
jgi:hypothetical protein